MEHTRNQPSAGKFWSWFFPIGRQAGGWAFALNRVTAIGLTLYLFLHLAVLSLLAQGPGSYDKFLALTENPFIKLGEWAVVAAVFLHGLNGIRIILTSFGIGVTRQKQLFYAFMIIAVFVILIFTARMY
ncbi:MAG TPA: succinate dehydrogenase, cytochrome b556 subunit [Anaerolineales bacterium]|nr:succinate dehydrogenase, cytochrome b556 subunit [Anaerolineales bacterium]